MKQDAPFKVVETNGTYVVIGPGWIDVHTDELSASRIVHYMNIAFQLGKKKRKSYVG